MGNCLKKNVIIDGIPDRWDIDEYFKDIEDVWGHVAIENNVKIDSGKFCEYLQFYYAETMRHSIQTKPQKLPLKT